MATAILIILDGLGVGAAPDAADYGDIGSDTLGNMSREVGGIHVPYLQKLGLGNLATIKGVPPVDNPMGNYGRLQEISAGKDSTTGHWELMGVHTQTAFPTYPKGFPKDVLDEFSQLTGYGVIGNKAASGTAIIEELGDEHLASRNLIVYTSADSVFQIAAHDKICDKAELYRVCEIARKMLKPPHNVSRVIARPFTGLSGNFQRTPYRHDYSVNPPKEMILPKLQKQNVHIQSIGKIYDLYNGFGIDQSHTSLNNQQGMLNLQKIYSETSKDSSENHLILLNLVDFDMLWGHRNDPQGMKGGLEAFDRWLGPFLESITKGDMLLMTADHGNDPTTPTTDHSREFVPILSYIGGQQNGKNIGTRIGFMDVGATIADLFQVNKQVPGESFL